MPTTKRKKAKAQAKPAARPRARPAPAPQGVDADLRGLVADLALLTAMNNVMAQTAFLTVERLRISSEVVDESVSNEFGSELFARCEKLVRASDDLILQALDHAAPGDARAEAVRDLVRMRRAFQDKTGRPMEQPRLVESMERMYR